MDPALQDQAARYLLGELPPGEAVAFERRLDADADLRRQLRAQQRELERLTRELPVPGEPPPVVRDRLLAAAAADPRFPARTTPEAEETAAPAPDRPPRRQRPRVAGAGPDWRDFFLRTLAGALPLALLAACGGLWWLREAGQRENSTLRERERELTREVAALRAAAGDLTGLRTERDQLQRETAALRGQAEDRTREAASLRQQLEQARGETLAVRDQDVLPRLQVGVLHPAPAAATLPATPPTAPTAAPPGGIALWDPQRQRGMLLVENLPVPRPDQDYQVWVADPARPQPVPSGVFHPVRPVGRQTLAFVTGETVNRAAQFMVTLERKGGVTRITGPAVLESARQP